MPSTQNDRHASAMMIAIANNLNWEWVLENLEPIERILETQKKALAEQLREAADAFEEEGEKTVATVLRNRAWAWDGHPKDPVNEKCWPWRGNESPTRS